MSKFTMTMDNVFTMLKTHKDNEYKAIYVQFYTKKGLEFLHKFSVFEEYNINELDGYSNTLDSIYKEMSFYPFCYELPVESVAFHSDGTVFINLEGRN